MLIAQVQDIQRLLTAMTGDDEVEVKRKLARIAETIRNPPLAEHLSKLPKTPSFDDWLKEQNTQGPFAFPVNEDECLLIRLRLLEGTVSGRISLTELAVRRYSQQRNARAAIQETVTLLYRTLADDLKAFLERHRLLDLRQRDVANTAYTPLTHLSGVFIVHGRNIAFANEVARVLEKQSLVVTILHEEANQGRTVIEKFEDHSDVGYSVVLMTADDSGSERGGTPLPRARQNVLIELGYFMGKHGRKRVAIVSEVGVEIPSDLAGIARIEYQSGNDGWKFQLLRELREAGFAIDLNKS